MTHLIYFIFVLQSFIGVHALLFATGRREQDPSLEDVLQFSKDAESLGALYEKEASQLPSEKQQRQAIAEENVITKGSLDEETANDIGYEHIGTCSRCTHDYRNLCPKGWQQKEADGACVAPDNYQGTCG